MLRIGAFLSLCLMLLAFIPARALAFEDYWGTRALGMGGATRAFAVGDAGPLLNPSGMSLLKSYWVEGGYEYGHSLSENFLHASVVDGTSAYNLAGGLYYTYHLSNPPGGTSGHGHEAGFALSAPLGDLVSLGATVKYLRLEGSDTGPNDVDHGVTFDVGTTIRPTPALSLALVGANLYNLRNGQTPRSLAYGATYIPLPALFIAVDGRTSFTPNNQTGREGTSIFAGVDYTFVQKFGVRVGGGYDADTGNGYLTAGFSMISEIGAVDLGFRQDITQGEIAPGIDSARNTVAAISVRLFIPAADTQPQP